MIYFFIGLGILLLGLVTLIIKIKGLQEVEKKHNITEEKISEILKTKKDNLDKISRDMDDKKLINKLKEDNDNLFKFEQNLYDVKFEIKKRISNDEYTPSEELKKLLDDIDLEEKLEGLKDYYNSNSIKYNELLYKKPFNYIYKLFKLDAKNTFKIQVSEELEILKKAFGNNLNIGYLNTLSNTEEEKFITIINKYNFEEEKSNSKLNEKIKELVKDIPINYRLALDLYLGFYDGKKYTVDELSLILNLPAYEIKTRIKNGIIYIKNILNTKDLESQKELNTLIKSL